MKTSENRRSFLIKSGKVCLACMGYLAARGLQPGVAETSAPAENSDLKKLAYCSFDCPGNCELMKATLENDAELKKKIFEEKNIGGKYKMSFKSEDFFCYGCKTRNKPEGIVLKKCTVRLCARNKGLDSCVQCSHLLSCEKELWLEFPEFKQSVLEKRRAYLEREAINHTTP